MPLVSVLLAVHDDVRFVRLAVDSVLEQTLGDVELIVIDDASTDATPDALAAIADPRLVVLRNEDQLGLASSLNRGFERASGRYVARLDADDIAFPNRLELQVARLRADPRAAIVGAAVVDVDEVGRPGRLHRLPGGATAVRWHALFSSPFFHPTVLVDREPLDKHGLRYDAAFLESEDYDLWARLLELADGDNLRDALVLKRVHPGQATSRRAGLQRSFQRQVALRQVESFLPDAAEAELAWRFGAGGGGSRHAYLRLFQAFEDRHGPDGEVRAAVEKRLARAGRPVAAMRAAPRIVRDRVRRQRETWALHHRANEWLDALQARQDRVRVAVVSPEPTPYRAPLFDRIAARPDVDLRVLYAARTVAARTWQVEVHHRNVFLRGIRMPGMRRVVHHDYPLTPGVFHALYETRPDVVVVSGWSTFASQAAVGWSRAHGTPYVLLVESHDLGPRSSWRRAVKDAVVPRLVRRASGALAVGSLARGSLVARGALPERVRVFANTIDVSAWVDRADRLAGRRSDVRRDLGVADQDVVVLSVGRLVPEKGFELLVRAVAGAYDPRLAVVVAGAGPQATALERLASELAERLDLVGDLDEDRLAELYVAADVFSLLSEREPWGVVVNEAAASGLPLLLSDQVGAAHDLLRDGENGFLVQAGDVAGAAEALRRLASDAQLRRTMGRRSRELVRGWSYEPSVESFVAAVREATSR
jgi:glycosyltransferase involved in cell wall biosynthesis/GT2 family glycosyltransferase